MRRPSLSPRDPDSTRGDKATSVRSGSGANAPKSSRPSSGAFSRMAPHDKAPHDNTPHPEHTTDTRGNSPQSRLALQPPPPAAPGSTWLSRVLVLAVVSLAVFLMVFSPLKSWMEQQQHARELAAEIARTKAENEALEDEIARYQDPEYVSRQARERLGFVKPGETTYVVVDPPGQTKPKVASGWVEKDANDLPWFGLIVEGLKVAGTGKSAGK